MVDDKIVRIEATAITGLRQSHARGSDGFVCGRQRHRVEYDEASDKIHPPHDEREKRKTARRGRKREARADSSVSRISAAAGLQRTRGSVRPQVLHGVSADL